VTDPLIQPYGPSGGMDLATAKQKLDDLLEDMRRNPLKYLKQQTAEGQQRAQFADAPSMTAGPSGPVHEWTREEFQAYGAAHVPRGTPSSARTQTRGLRRAVPPRDASTQAGRRLQAAGVQCAAGGRARGRGRREALSRGGDGTVVAPLIQE